ncbi:MAG: nucleotidyl transferase AbiEii/AbiGii toxin family protein [Halobacteria archaeon]|nr:nucleotidyl transferase AbiEii/AbiGii toxin family protein [Halobacteria archaeon]
MLSESEIESVAQTLTNGNRGHAEKLYLQDIVLSTVSRETVDELVFKGGTALLKFYQLDRFSEDLDFTLDGNVDLGGLVDKSVRDLNNYGATVEDRMENETEEKFEVRLGIQGPLYMGERRSLCFVRVQAHKEASVMGFENRRYNPMFQDIMSFDLAVLTQEEILAEKIRAIMTRNQAKDLYDVYHLLEKGVEIQPELVQGKLDYYDIEYRPDEVVEQAEKLRKNWGSLGTLVYPDPPEFEEALETLRDKVR